MKITHVSLCGPVTDNLTYQDNLLPKYHKNMGLDVSMITSKYIWNEGTIDIDDRHIYINEYGIKTIRLDNKFNTNINSKFKRYDNLYRTIEKERPNILFVHGVQFLDIKEVVKYAQNYPHVIIYADSHADFSNSATNWVSKNILHKIIWKKTAHMIEPYATKIYGVTPGRVDFLKEIYNLPENKLDLLVMGADDEKVEKYKSDNYKEKIRKQFNINQDDFLIATGGKIDKAKLQVLNLMNVVAKMNNKNIKLIVYGSVIPDMQDDVYKLAEHESIEFIGWINDDQSSQLFSAADLVVFPGRHSVYWEQVVAMGIPMIVKYWEGTTHIDIGENCMFLYEDTEEELSDVLKRIIQNENVYGKLLQNAQSDDRKQFMYSEIARKSIL